jgi:predicted RNase H-related nuclease YkuK (DUF458 family)
VLRGGTGRDKSGGLHAVGLAHAIFNIVNQILVINRKMKMRQIIIPEIIEFISSQSAETKIYIGADSERLNVKGDWYADYTLAIVVHIDGNHGCKVFGEVQRERDYDKRQDRPRMRLMTEVYKIAELYLKLAEVLEDRYVEVHLDINPDEIHGSSCVLNEAIGYIKGMCNVVPMVKPHAFAASVAADRMKDILAA